MDMTYSDEFGNFVAFEDWRSEGDDFPFRVLNEHGDAVALTNGVKVKGIGFWASMTEDYKDFIVDALEQVKFWTLASTGKKIEEVFDLEKRVHEEITVWSCMR